jgi:hypothetical protein
MNNILAYLYTKFMLYARFILAIAFWVMSYLAYTVHYTVSVKVILFFIMGVLWAAAAVNSFAGRAKSL